MRLSPVPDGYQARDPVTRDTVTRPDPVTRDLRRGPVWCRRVGRARCARLADRRGALGYQTCFAVWPPAKVVRCPVADQGKQLGGGEP